MTNENDRKLAGLAIGTTWYDHEKEQMVVVDKARIEEDNGIEFVRLLYKNRPGGKPADTFYTEIRAGLLDPQGVDADAAYTFVKGEEDG